MKRGWALAQPRGWEEPGPPWVWTGTGVESKSPSGPGPWRWAWCGLTEPPGAAEGPWVSKRVPLHRSGVNSGACFWCAQECSTEGRTWRGWGGGPVWSVATNVLCPDSSEEDSKTDDQGLDFPNAPPHLSATYSPPPPKNWEVVLPKIQWPPSKWNRAQNRNTVQLRKESSISHIP